jgi:hypothetical protein
MKPRVISPFSFTSTTQVFLKVKTQKEKITGPLECPTSLAGEEFYFQLCWSPFLALVSGRDMNYENIVIEFS